MAHLRQQTLSAESGSQHTRKQNQGPEPGRRDSLQGLQARS